MQLAVKRVEFPVQSIHPGDTGARRNHETLRWIRFAATMQLFFALSLIAFSLYVLVPDTAVMAVLSVIISVCLFMPAVRSPRCSQLSCHPERRKHLMNLNKSGKSVAKNLIL